MANIGDLFPQLASNAKDALIKIGAIFKLPLSEEDGITPKYGQLYRDKYIVVIGFTKDGDIVGALIVNKGINKHNYTKELIKHHYPLNRSKYKDVFKKNSFACCTSIKPLERIKIINTADHIGDLLEEDLRLITSHLSASEVIPNSVKRRFGLI